MPDFFTLTCPTCGGKLRVTKDTDRFACEHCGNEHVVKRSGGVVSLTPVMEKLEQVKASVDKTVSELAIQRLTKEIRAITQQIAEVEMQPRLRQNARQASAAIRWQRLGGFLFIVIGMFLGWIDLQIGRYDSGFALLGIVGVFSIGIGCYVAWQSTQTAASMSLTPIETKQLGNLQKLLKEKQAELTHHYQIVNV